MKHRNYLAAIMFALLAAACGRQAEQDPASETDPPATSEETAVTEAREIETIVIAPGLTARILESGSGDVAEAGDLVVVHYTGWLYDETAPDNRGKKFDSSVDRGEHFNFPLGAGRVIKGWDQGVAGMAIGEVRELTIAPEMAYGDRDVGEGLIPPGSTLVFEVELFETQNLADSAGQ